MRYVVWKAEARTNLKGYYSIIKDIREGVIKPVNDPSNPYGKAMTGVAEEYRAFLKRNYNKKRKPGGWRKVSPRTLAWRLKKYGLKRIDPLFVTRTLYRLTDKVYDFSKGHFQRRTKYGITVGVNQAVMHPDYPGNLRKLVELHASGKNRIPKRKIVIPPSEEAKNKMHRLFSRAHTQALKKANGAYKK